MQPFACQPRQRYIGPPKLLPTVWSLSGRLKSEKTTDSISAEFMAETVIMRENGTVSELYMLSVRREHQLDAGR